VFSISRDADVTQITLRSWRSAAVGYSVNVYLVRGLLVDTGFPGARSEVARLLDEMRPAGAIVTHQHEDHAGNLGLVGSRGLPVAIAPITLTALRSGEARVGLYRRMCWGSMPPLRQSIREFSPTGLRLVSTPGHSPDHHVVWDDERETLFSGDLFLGVRVRVARPMEDPRALARSLRVAAMLQPRRMFDAHRGEISDPVRSLLAKADWMDETILAVDDRIARGWSDRAIARDVLGCEDLISYASLGDLSRLNFVRAVRATTAGASP
jgi:glyoxylase-like metal-dependent hydrolase (beta-lactamase superfamily II)